MIHEYQRRFAQLYEQLNTPPPEGIDPDLYRSFAIEQFNTRFCNLNGRGVDAIDEDDPLASIRYYPKLDADGSEMLADRTIIDIASFMNELPLFEVFGLNLNEVLSLPFNEWQIVKTEMLKYTTGKRTRSQIDAEAQRRTLVKVMTEAFSGPTSDRPTPPDLEKMRSNNG